MTMVGLPMILFTVGEADLGDLEFIRDRVLAGEWVEAFGAINAITNTISIVPANGKTLFMYRAKIVPTTHPSPPGTAATPYNLITKNQVQAAFKVDGTQKDTANCGVVFGSTGDSGGRGGGIGAGDTKGDRFDVTGLSLVGNGIKAVTVENTLDNGSADATMSGWIETT